VNDSISAISPAWPTRWPKDSFKGLLTWLVVGLITLLFVGFFVFATEHPPQTSHISPLELILGLGLQFALEGILVLGVLLALPAMSKFSLRELGFRRPDLRVLGIAAIGALAMIVVADGSAGLVNFLTHSQHQQDVIQIFKSLHNPGTIAFFAFFAIVFAPFAEESLFRVLYFNLGVRYGGFWTGAVLSGALFGIAHADLLEAVPLALGGIVLCVVYYRSRNAWASMISHSLFNTLSIVLLLFAPKLTQ
jgi:membrane protease YdiL (CAAX protease family)